MYVMIKNEANLPAAGSIFVSIGGGRIIGKVFQCHKTSFAKSITGFMYSSVSKIKKRFTGCSLFLSSRPLELVDKVPARIGQ